MTPEDFKIFMRGLDSIGPQPALRWYAESDGDPHMKTYYATNNYCALRIDCASMKEAREVAKAQNSLIAHI